MAKIPGTNIDESVLAGMDENKKEEILDRIATDIAAGDTEGANDALFSLAYWSGSKAGQGQGNPNVGKLQSGQWKLNEGETWAEQAVKSESGTSDIYIQRDDQGNVREDDQGRAITHTGVDFGKPMTADDVARSTAGVTRFYGTNIPTTGIPQADINRINQRLIDEIAKGDKNMAADAIHEATNALWKAKGLDADTNKAAYKQFMSQVYSGQFQFTPDTGLTNYADIVTQDPTKGTSDFYNIRDLSGNIVRSVQGRDYTGTPTYNPSQIGAGGSGEYLSTPYSRPALQDWSHLAPPTMPGLLGSAQAQQALLGNNLANYQPQAQGGVLDYAPRGGSTWAPRRYATTRDDIIDTGAGAGAGAGTGNGKTYGPGGKYSNYQDWFMAEDNPFGHYWALANTARANNEVSPWGNEMEGGIWKYDPSRVVAQQRGTTDYEGPETASIAARSPAATTPAATTQAETILDYQPQYAFQPWNTGFNADDPTRRSGSFPLGDFGYSQPNMSAANMPAWAAGTWGDRDPSLSGPYSGKDDPIIVSGYPDLPEMQPFGNMVAIAPSWGDFNYGGSGNIGILGTK